MSSVTGKNEKLDKQKAENKGGNETNSVKRIFQTKGMVQRWHTGISEWIPSVELLYFAGELPHI